MSGPRVSADGVEIPPGLYEETKKLVAACTIDASYDIPYLALRSQDGRIVYRDRHMPRLLPKCRIDTDETLPWHELAEWLRQNAGDKYPDPAHYIATAVEKRRIFEIAARDELGPGEEVWKRYTEETNGYVKAVEREKIMRFPRDGDLRPFQDEHDRRVLREIARAEEAEKSTFSGPASATSGLQGYDLEGAALPHQRTKKRTLSIKRKLLNAHQLIEWAKGCGFTTTLPADDMRVTVAYIREPVDWDAIGTAPEALRIPAATGKRSLERYGPEGGIVVLAFESPELSARHEGIRHAGASCWDPPSYRPHIGITYKSGALDIEKIDPYAGPLEFDAEIFAEINPQGSDRIVEKNDASFQIREGFGAAAVNNGAGGPANTENTAVNNLSLFVPITKIDAAQRMVYGTAAVEMIDKAHEIFDYASSKPLFEAWSAEVEKNSNGKSLGNVRAMHGHVAAGKLTSLAFDDARKAIDVAAKIVDDAEWTKCEEGVYTGFSIGGKYEKRWKDGEATRYTAQPSEISIVDLPCIPDATFSMVKADGSVEDRRFKAAGAVVAGPSNEQVASRAIELAKAAGSEAKWADFIAQAREELEKEGAAASADSTQPKGAKLKGKHPGRQGHMDDEGDEETLIADESDPRPGVKKPKPKDGSAAQERHAEPLSDSEKEQTADSTVSHKATPSPRDSGTGEWEQVWVSKRLPGKTFAKKSALQQALLELDAAEAAVTRAAPVLDALKGLSEQLDRRASGATEQPVPEVMKRHSEQVRRACDVLEDDWASALEFLDQDGEHALAKALQNAPRVLVKKDGSIETTSELLKAVRSFVAGVKDELRKREWTAEERREAASRGEALPDGSYPIRTKEDLRDAVQAYGRAKNKAAARRHIVRRAKALGATDMLPENWRGSTKNKKDAGEAGDLTKSLRFVQGLVGLLAMLESWEDDYEAMILWAGEDSERRQNATRFGTVLTDFADLVADILDHCIENIKQEEREEALARTAAVIDLMKRGARHSASDRAIIKEVHDAMVKLDKDCCEAANAVKTVNADPAIEALTKQLADKDAAFAAEQAANSKVLAEIGVLLKDVAECVKRIEDTPQPLPGQSESLFRPIEKGAEMRRNRNDEDRAPPAWGAGSPYAVTPEGYRVRI